MESTTTIGKKMYLAFLAVILAAILPSVLSIPFRRFIPQENALIITGFLGTLLGLILAFVMY